MYNYKKQLQNLFRQKTNELLCLVKRTPTNDNEMYSFDAEGKELRKRINKKFQELHALFYACIKEGINVEWDKKLSPQVIEQPENNLSLLLATNALNAFINRVDNGMNLSKRVWNYVENYKQQLEVCLTVGIGTGKTAQELSKDVRQFLNRPNDYYRRFWYGTDGNKRVKWKKAYKDEQEHLHFRDVTQEEMKVGRGVYRSAYKNALRLTGTEINMAYRNADSVLWNSRDDIIGIKVQISNHANYKQRKKGEEGHKPDICDELAGIYPREFIFEGWHPNCHCIATPVFIPSSEQKAYQQAFLKGERYVSPSRITDCPQGFKDYINTQASGKEYFILHNKPLIQRTLTTTPLYNATSTNVTKTDGSGTTVQRTMPTKFTLPPQQPVLQKGTFDEYKCGDGIVQIHKNVNQKDSDYTRLVQVAEAFAKDGSTVLLAPKMHNVRTKEYDTIYGSLKGTKFYGKCPDICKNGAWYEHEGFTTDNAKKALHNMLTHGLKQSNKLVIDEPNLTDKYILHIILKRIEQGADIEEIHIRNETGRVRCLYKKTKEV